MGLAGRSAYPGNQTGDVDHFVYTLSAQLDELLAEVAALEQAEKSLGRGIEALRHALADLEFAGRDHAAEFGQRRQRRRR